ncbi:MAG: Uma2 family endonuclease, partial [Saprospiraceae bacterium]|nr:Uma2 family endonuclease [Saprospiraceae bacterium]
MTAAVAIPEKRTVAISASKGTEPKRISWEQFEKQYLTREDRYKYEWVKGQIEKTER